MKVSIGRGDAALGCGRDIQEQVAYVLEAEKLGVDTVWSAEAWGEDVVVPLTSFTPEHADAHLAYLREGAESAGRSLADIDIQAGGTVAFGDDVDALVEPLKAGMAFTLGAMGSPRTNSTTMRSVGAAGRKRRPKCGSSGFPENAMLQPPGWPTK